MAKSSIVVSGMIATDPHQGGATWAVLQYVLGFGRLGHDVYFIEPVRTQAIRPTGAPLAESVNADYFRRVADDFGLESNAALLREGTRETVGAPYEQLVRIAGRADLLVNISGMLTDPELTGPISTRVYLDLDPAFNQLWHTQGVDMRFAGHTHFVTIGQAIGRSDCAVPTCGLNWISTHQPIALDRWPVAGPIFHDAFTTVGNWRGYGSVENGGVFYGQKAHSLRKLITLPRRVPEQFLLALAIHPGETRDLAALAENDWRLVDPAEVAATPAHYQRFIQGSRAEFGVAKSGYVEAKCGWFSDRSVCYLASGRPVLAQDTGFTRFLPTGEGLFSFSTEDDVLAAAEKLRGDYSRHAKAACSLAEEFFHSDRVLTRLLNEVGAGS
jgi:hypothetical protein